ncbi:hypothetical protein, partial [Faecalicoccus sp.]|uniref:hypothetical protein n=1 Tax=Faecalicoccus sp. TaxID=1971758 RepID=UPI002A83155C
NENKKLWLDPFVNRQAIGHNKLIHSGFSKYNTWALAVANCTKYNIRKYIYENRICFNLV